MTRYKIKNQKILTCCSILVALLAHLVKCSEFPERECCDLTTTSTVGPLLIPPAAQPTEKTTITTSSAQVIPTGRSGSNIKAAIAILNCILARQLCFEDPSCSAILEIIPRVCGPIPVACATVTVTKCQAALRTLQAFPFFRPTCLCKEPGVDPDCNNFRDFLFDHPCGFVLKKAEKDPYPIDALPTCNHALSVCQQERKCSKLFDDFKLNCKVRDNKCRMDDRDLCHESWTNLRLSPMFGCICPNNHMKRRCDRIFNVVNHNPCVDLILISQIIEHQLPQSSESSNSVYYSDSNEDTTITNHNNNNNYYNNNNSTKQLLYTVVGGVSSFFSFLFPSKKLPLALASLRPATATDDEYNQHNNQDPYRHHHDNDGDGDDIIIDHDNINDMNIYNINLNHRQHNNIFKNTKIKYTNTNTNKGNINNYDEDDINQSQLPPSQQQQPPRFRDFYNNNNYNNNNNNKNLTALNNNNYNINYNYNNKNAFEHKTAEKYYSTTAPIDEHNHQLHNTINNYDLNYNNSISSINYHHPGKTISSNTVGKIINNNDRQNRPTTIGGGDQNYHQYHHHYRHNWDLKNMNMDERVRVMGMDDSYHQTVFDESLALIDTPLIVSTSTHSFHHHKGITYPYNLTAFQGTNTASMEVDGSSTNGYDYKSGQESQTDSSSEIIKLHFQSTCHTALDACREDPSCLTSLQPMLIHCESHRCNRNACMSALQQFYKGPHEDLSLDVAFCLCKKTPNRHDTCMISQEKLHPVCAQRPPDNIYPQNSNGIYYHPPPGCHIVADLCKEDRECRIKLEFYEQACAVDSVTKKCAGRPSSCRSAMIGILGTPLRMTCACQGTDVTNLYQCLGWQRLLWLNPCVVEAQKDFHMKRLAELGLLTTLPTTTSTTTTTTTTTTTPAPTHPPIIYVKTTRTPIVTKIVPKPRPPIHSNEIEEQLPVTLKENEPNINDLDDLDKNNDDTYEPPESEEDEKDMIPYLQTELIPTPELTTISTTTSTTTEPTTTQAPRNCVVQRPHQSDQLIPEGSSRRIYLLEESECSDLCTCGESLTLTCHALCVQFTPCRTALAFYSHASPAYQAYRGRCLCYSGRFICMKPPLGEYTLPGGIFLLLGYSSTDEALLRPHTNLGVQDAVRALQQYVVKHINNETQCVLTLFNMTDENVIISAQIPSTDPKLKSIDMLRREKDECTPILQTISEHINSQHSELQAHRLLSIFKMSEVEVIWPDKSASATLTNTINNYIKLFNYNIATKYIFLILTIIITIITSLSSSIQYNFSSTTISWILITKEILTGT